MEFPSAVKATGKVVINNKKNAGCRERLLEVLFARFSIIGSQFFGHTKA
jgi:hypothetical protein